ncbi:MAG: DUF58 domain-containing protein [Cellvibrionales bacterium]|nr:DUF58 domain-containing protein [Cellvibrionales bacterium]
MFWPTSAAAGGSPWRRWAGRWLDRRQPETARETLSRRNLYILPAGQFAGFATVLGLMWLAGTNYENNLILALAFLLLAVFVSAIFATHANLSGLRIAVRGGESAFAGEPLSVHLHLENPSATDRFALVLKWGGAVQRVDVAAGATLAVQMALPTEKRGWLRPGRLLIETRYPLGLLRAWSCPRLRVRALVYPRPVPAEAGGGALADGGAGQSPQRGMDDFAGLDEWRPGTAPQRIAWKPYSAGRGLLEKTFEAQSMNPEWLDWQHYPGLGVEARLSALCAKIIEMQGLGQCYGLRLPGRVFAPAQGEAHRHRLLTALATFGLED